MTGARLIDFARALVRCPSFAGEEGDIVRAVIAKMHSLGFDEAWIDSNGSAVGTINGLHPGPTLLLDAHCDTVGVAPGVPWKYDPFGAAVEADTIYGRGVADMKGALAAMIHAASALNRAKIAGRVAVSATVMEENLEGAALKAIMEATRPHFVVIGEATDLNLARGGRGRAEVHLETIGQPAHSSTPRLGRNAVHDMLRVVAAVESIPAPSDAFLGEGIWALTDIISDPYPAYSVIPARCRVTYDRRLLLGETPDGILATLASLTGLGDIDVRARIAHGEHRTWTGAVLQGPKFMPAWALPENDAWVQTALGGLRAAGLTPRFTAYGFCTNAAYSAGTASVPTVGFGPGSEADAHTVDEKLEIGALLAAWRGYQGIIHSALGIA